MNRLDLAVRVWLLSFVVCVAAVALSFAYADLPIAVYCSRFAGPLMPLGEGFGSAVVLSGEALTVMAIVFARLTRGEIPRYAEALALACLTSICAYAIDNGALKVFFGVPNPVDVLNGAKHAFHFWKGTSHSGFPSGHMALAASFAGVFMRLYRKTIWPLASLLLIAGILLLLGEWHFLSDVIAGTFLGISAGLLAGELWDVHMRGAFR